MATKKHLTLNIDSEVAEKAVADPDVQVSELTEKMLRAFTTTSKTENNEIRYKAYQELFGLILPLLRKFKVRTKIAFTVLALSPPQPVDWDDMGNEVDWIGAEPIEWWDYYLQPNGKILREPDVEIEIKDIEIEDFFRPHVIVDNFLDSIQEGVNYRKDQFKEIEMAKTIIDAITKGVIPKIKGKGKKK